MRRLVFLGLILVLTVALAPSAWAADDGNTQPKFNVSSVYYPNAYQYIPNTTSGSGNVKGIHCNTDNGIELQISINGGTDQELYLPPGDTGWIPMNLRFTSSIRVKMINGNYYQNIAECRVSWALD